MHSQNPTVVGRQVTLTAVITPTAATGTVEFTGPADTALTGCATRPVSAGAASCAYTFPAAGSDQITATYSRDGNDAGSTDTLTQQVNPPSTTDVTVYLADSAGNPLTGGTATYYARGWHTIGTTNAGGDVTVQMLPGYYSFAVTYHGTRQQLNQQTVSGTASTVDFASGAVHSTSGSATGYYGAGKWRTFTNDMQLLPGTYTFRFDDGTPNTRYTLGGAITTIH